MYFKGLFVALSCVVAGIIAAPTNVHQEPIPILSQSEELQSNGSYKFSYETGNGIIREESAYNKVLPKGRDASSNEGGESNDSEEIHVQRGSYSYTAPDGTVISVRYIADENGFQPIYEHIPNQGNAKSADKSGRAFKLETLESALGLAPRIGSSHLIEENSAEKSQPQNEVAPKVLSESAIAPNAAPVAVSKAAPAIIPDVASASVPQEVPAADPETSSDIKIESVPVSQAVPSVVLESAPAAIPESVPEVVPDVTPSVEAASTVNEALIVSTENALSITESGATEASEASTPIVDVSTDVASNAASDQPSIEPEQGTIASAVPEPEQSSSSEVVESSSSTSAPEQSGTTEAIGQQAIEESVASSPAEEVGQPAANSSEPAAFEESISTTISA